MRVKPLQWQPGKIVDTIETPTSYHTYVIEGVTLQVVGGKITFPNLREAKQEAQDRHADIVMKCLEGFDITLPLQRYVNSVAMVAILLSDSAMKEMFTSHAALREAIR